ncbi:pectin acetylesterase 4-like isoform X3 [Rosa rugosa]|uniref:pectin acetylesterase 4-like isoform X3 n=1 Tax=Rosa rugosa TaxID=74645 RepID=UPI002B416E88|nr:pectin acetylesterase 4-like isoform X3 [Rosa rugosa]
MDRRVPFFGILSSQPSENPAGGLATLIHCDDFRGLLPRDSRIQLSNVMLMQDLAKSLHKDCVARKEPAKCLFPEKIIKHVSRQLQSLWVIGTLIELLQSKLTAHFHAIPPVII